MIQHMQLQIFCASEDFAANRAGVLAVTSVTRFVMCPVKSLAECLVALLTFVLLFPGLCCAMSREKLARLESLIAHGALVLSSFVRLLVVPQM